MNVQTERFPPLLRNATLGRHWLLQMSQAAERHGISIQYCMAFCRHVLQSVESVAVTQVRASGDYRAGNELWACAALPRIHATKNTRHPHPNCLCLGRRNRMSTRLVICARYAPCVCSPLGVTSLFAFALGLAPSKDTFWSTADQPGNRWGDRTREPFSRLQVRPRFFEILLDSRAAALSVLL